MHPLSNKLVLRLRKDLNNYTWHLVRSLLKLTRPILTLSFDGPVMTLADTSQAKSKLCLSSKHQFG